MYPPERMTTPEPLSPVRPLLARTVTTDGSARSATVAAGQAAAVPPAVAELPFPEFEVPLTISPPATPPMIAAATNPLSTRTIVRPRQALDLRLPTTYRTAPDEVRCSARGEMVLRLARSTPS